MNRSYGAFYGVFFGAVSILAVVGRPSTKPQVAFFPPPLIEFSDAESLLATGGKVVLSSATAYDLMLIPGISDIGADKILEAREAILKSARHLPIKSRYRALTVVHGIAEKTAVKYGGYIEVR